MPLSRGRPTSSDVYSWIPAGIPLERVSRNPFFFLILLFIILLFSNSRDVVWHVSVTGLSANDNERRARQEEFFISLLASLNDSSSKHLASPFVDVVLELVQSTYTMIHNLIDDMATVGSQGKADIVSWFCFSLLRFHFLVTTSLIWLFFPFFFPDGPPICQRFDHSDTLRPFPSSLITVQTRFLSFLIFFFCSGRHVPATPARISFSTRPTRPIIISFSFRIPFWQQTIRTSCSATAALQRFLLGNRKWENK